MTKIEKTEIWMECEQPFTLPDVAAVRGFLGNLYCQRPEFHGHKGSGFVYKHPLIQYKVIDAKGVIIGLKEGAYLLKAIPKLKILELHYKKYTILKQDIHNNMVPFGLTEDMIRYDFMTPWIGLNEKNYQIYIKLQKKTESVNTLLERILIGNFLSMSKALGYVVKGNIRAKVRLEENGFVEAKQGIKLLAFKGEFKTNFFIPDFWGVGKFSSRGYGIVRRNSEGDL